jgi:hypothetical protein
MKLKNKKYHKSVIEKVRNLEKEMPYLKGRKREEKMNTYHKLLLSDPDQLVYFTRT